MHRSILLAIGVLAAAATPAAATLLYYEPFRIGTSPAAGEYVVGPVAGQNPTVGPTPFQSGAWTTQADAPNTSIQATGLNYLSAPALGGSLISTPNGRPRRGLTAPLGTATTGTYYISFLVNFGQGNYSDGIQDNDLGYRAAEFWQNPDGSGFTLGVHYNQFAGDKPSTARINFDMSGQRTVVENSPLNFMEDGATHMFVLRLSFSDQPAADSAALIYDPLSTNEPAADVTRTGLDLALGAMGGVSIFGGSGAFPVYDELRVATTFAEALPELPTPGDTNGDHFVDLVDYNNIVSHFGQNVTTALEGDVAKHNGTQGSDGRVDIGDFRLWRDKRMDVAAVALVGASGQFVPEPSVAALSALAALPLGFSRRRRCL